MIMRAIHLICFLLLLLMTVPAWAQDTDEDSTEPVDPLATAQTYKDQARKLGAKGNLPAAWNTYEKKLKDAEKDTLEAGALAALELEGRRLVNRAGFLRDVKESRGPLENLLGRYDRSLRETAALMGLEIEPMLTGDEASARLIELLADDRLARQISSDSLLVRNRRLEAMVGGRVAAQDSIITALRVEVSSLRKGLWETELRAGVAEADRSAAESALTRRQAQEQAVQEITADLGAAASNVIQTGDGAIILQVSGLDFAVGSANLAPGQSDLMNKLAAAVGRFPGAAILVEGHTDDTGSRSANLKLSLRRAATVAGGLERRLDLPEGSVATAGHGPDRPVAPNSTPEGRAMNRRIDVVIRPLS